MNTNKILNDDNGKWMSEQLNFFDDILKYGIKQDISVFTKQVLHQLSLLSNAYKSIFFLYDEQHERLDAIATYGCLLSKIEQKSYQLGEGLVGQSIVSKKGIYLDNISKGNVFANFSFVNIELESIFVTPVFLDEKISGAILFFFLKKPIPLFFKLLDVIKQKLAFILENSQLHSKKISLEIEKNETLSTTIDEVNKITMVLSMQNEEIQKNLNQLAQNHKRITESLLYAKRIQSIILPNCERMSNFFDEHFVIYEPKDIVSGDFYWFVKTEEKIFLAIVDCTGHGVSGAFMSIMGSTLLNRIVIEERIHSPNTILLKLHKYIQIMLQQDTSKNTDGMDLSLCCFEIQDANIKDIKLTFSGAKSDVVFIKDDKISILKGDRNSIGGTYQNDENSFHNQTVYLNKGDSLYLFTDGFADTCNEKRKKFGEQKLKNLIFEHKSLSMILQQQVFLSALYEFKNNAEQRDDITLFGIRL